MAQTLRSAIAVPFTWTSSAPDIVLTFSAGTSPVNVTVASGTYYVCLGTSAQDFVRVVEAAVNAALAAALRAEVFTFTVQSDSRVYVESTGVFSFGSISDALKMLGFSASVTSAQNATATYPPKHLATFVSRVSQGWVARTAAAGAETLAGIGYGVSTGVYREEDDVALDFIPLDPANRTALGLDQSTWQPDYGLTLGDHVGPWSVRDVLATAQGKTLHAALGNFQAIRTSTSERYDLVTMPTSEITTPRRERTREGWDAYFRWTVRLLRQSTQTGTRA